MAKQDDKLAELVAQPEVTTVQLQAPDGVAVTIIENVAYKVVNGVITVPAQHKDMLLESFGYTLSKKSK